MRLHKEEIPPDIYYDRLAEVLDDMFPGTSEGFLAHVIAFVAAGDTAAAFCISFGISKFQLAQIAVKLVGEIVSREGRSPNPAICAAVRNWPSIKTLNDLQSFLGTLNYIRPHCGAAFSLKYSPNNMLTIPYVDQMPDRWDQNVDPQNNPFNSVWKLVEIRNRCKNQRPSFGSCPTWKISFSVNPSASRIWLLIASEQDINLQSAIQFALPWR